MHTAVVRRSKFLPMVTRNTALAVYRLGDSLIVSDKKSTVNCYPAPKSISDVSVSFHRYKADQKQAIISPTFPELF